MAQNGTSNRTGLPNGMVPFHQIPDPQTRDAVMKLNENVAWLARRPAGGGDAVVQYKDAQNLLDSIEANYPNAAAAASAIPQALAAKTAAEGAASSATASAASATANAAAAAASASSASASAAAAASYAADAALAGSINYANVSLGSLSSYRVYMAALVDDASATYRVQIRFVNTENTARTVQTSLDGTEIESFQLNAGLGETVTKEYEMLGSGYFLVNNADASVQVFIKAWRIVEAPQ